MSAALVERISGTSAFQWPRFLACQTSFRLTVYRRGYALCHTDQNSARSSTHRSLQHPCSRLECHSYAVYRRSSCTYIRGQFRAEALQPSLRHPLRTFFLILRVYLLYWLTYLLRSGSGAGPKIEWAGAGFLKKIRWSGSGAGVTERDVSGERKFLPLPLRSHALREQKA